MRARSTVGALALGIVAIGAQAADPTVRNLPATLGVFIDTHGLPPGQPFVTPYGASSFTGVQRYRYTCPCANGGSPVNLMGLLNIVRSVSQNTNGSWKYTVTKPTNGQASINPLP